jgi:hypothetical protein
MNREALAPTRARHKTGNNSRNTKWSTEEDRLLVQLRAGNSTVHLSEFVHLFRGKTTQQVTERWDKVLNPSLVKGSWTREEDETIVKFVQREGTKNWAKLAALLPGRVGKQCRERWRNHLDPDVHREPWTEQEDAILMDLHERLGNQWVKMVESLPGRSDNAIKNRWNSTLSKRLEEAKTGTPRRRRGRPARGTAAPKSADDIPRPPKFDEMRQSIPPPPQSAVPEWMSPFEARSPSLAVTPPFMLLSPELRERAFGLGTPTFGLKDGDGGIPVFSLMLFGGSENSADHTDLFSPQ